MRRPFDPVSDVRWLEVQNDSDDDAPPGALLRVTGVSAEGVFAVNKPSRNSQAGLWVAGPLGILAGQKGLGTLDYPIRAAYDPGAEGAETPSAGEVWGSKANEWELFHDFEGYLVLGGLGATVEVVVAPPSAPASPVALLTTFAPAPNGGGVTPTYPATRLAYKTTWVMDQGTNQGYWAEGETVQVFEANYGELEYGKRYLGIYLGTRQLSSADSDLYAVVRDVTDIPEEQLQNLDVMTNLTCNNGQAQITRQTIRTKIAP